MVLYVLSVALLNLVVGYLAAVCLTDPPPWVVLGRWRRLRRPPPTDTQPRAGGALTEPLPAAGRATGEGGLAARLPPPPVVAGIEELPQEWLDRLAANGIVPQSVVEGVAQIVRLDVNHYREQLLETEVSLRAVGAVATRIAAQSWVDRLRMINQEWLDQQTAAANVLGQRSGRLGEYEQAAIALEQVLLDQAAQIRGVLDALGAWDTPSSETVATRPLVEQTLSLLTQAHAVRDRILDLLASLLHDGDQAPHWPATVDSDPVTGLPNRLGVERLLRAWWRDDPQRTRLLSLLVLDIDRFGRLNQRLGTVWADRTAAALGRLIYEALPREGGFEHLARIGGQAFLVLLGDVGPHQALSLAERLRQTVEATTFEAEGIEFELSVSGGVTEVRPGESGLALFERVLATLRHAKRAGRNRCALDEGNGPVMLDPPQFPVKGRVVPLLPETTDVPFAASPAAPAATPTAVDGPEASTATQQPAPGAAVVPLLEAGDTASQPAKDSPHQPGPDSEQVAGGAANEGLAGQGQMGPHGFEGGEGAAPRS